LRKNAIGVKYDPNELVELLKIHNEKYFLRIAVFADIFNRFVDIELKGKVNLLKIFTLAIIMAAGGTMTPTQLQHNLLRTRHGITQIIDRLIKEGLVTREDNSIDRRVINIQITKKGVLYMKDIYNIIDIAENEIRTTVKLTDLKKLVTLNKSIRKRLLEIIADKI
jgi:DNA-binding MarR family transcriptional regulator